MPDTFISKGTAHVFGADAISDAKCTITVTSFSISTKPGVRETVTDEQGRTIHIRMDDFIKELSLEGFLPSDTGVIPVPGDVITYRTISWLVEEVERRGESKAFTKISVKAINFPKVSLT